MLPRLRDRLRLLPWQRTLYIAFFAQVITAIGFSSIFPFLPLYVEDLGSVSNLSVELLSGLVFSVQAFTMMLASPIWGALADRFGRKLMVQRAAFGGAAMLLVMAFAQNAEQLVVMRAVQGLITGVISANNALVASVAPRQRSGFAMGLLQVGLGAGVAIGPLMGGALADAFGYQSAFYITAALLFVAGIVVWLGVYEDFDPQAARQRRSGGMIAEYRSVLTSDGILPTYGMRFLSQMGRMMIVPIAPFFAQMLVVSQAGINSFIGLVLGAASAATTISAIYLGRLGDRIGHRRILISSVLAAGALYMLQSQISAGWQFLTLQILTGVASGGIIPAISALLANYSIPGEEGAVYGLDNSISAAGRGVAPLLGGAVAGWFGLRATFTATGLVLLLAAALAAWLLPKAPAALAAPQASSD